MADRRPVETLVERDDGVVFAMRGSGGGADLPHDLVHAVVEAELQVRDGIWGCVADGVGVAQHAARRRAAAAARRGAFRAAQAGACRGDPPGGGAGEPGGPPATAATTPPARLPTTYRWVAALLA